MRKIIVLLVLVLFSHVSKAQELFVVTDPASNVPAGSVSIRLGQLLFKEKFEDGYNYHLQRLPGNE
jgi:hypothetical protein